MYTTLHRYQNHQHTFCLEKNNYQHNWQKALDGLLSIVSSKHRKKDMIQGIIKNQSPLFTKGWKLSEVTSLNGNSLVQKKLCMIW